MLPADHLEGVIEHFDKSRADNRKRILITRSTISAIKLCEELMTHTRNHVDSVRFLVSRIFMTLVVLATQVPSASALSLAERLAEARKPSTTPSKYLSQATGDPSSKSLILLVHGVFGDAVGTWKLEGQPSLPEYVNLRSEFAGRFDVFAFGYTSSALKPGSFNVAEAANALRSDWDAYELGRYQRVVIVAHSMGGLVALEALSTFRFMREKVPMVVTFATPYDGVQIANIGNKLLANPALNDMISRDRSNGFITSLGNRWKELKEHEKPVPTVKCAYEKVPIPGLGLIVPPSSGTALCDGVADAIAEDHMGIVKPDSGIHGSVKVLVNALRLLDKSPLVDTRPQGGGRRVHIEQVNTDQLNPSVRFVADKVHRNLAELLSNAGHSVVAPPTSTAQKGGQPFDKVFALQVSSIGSSTSLDLQMKAADGSIIATTEIVGNTTDLAEIYKVIPDALLYGLNVDATKLVVKHSAKRPTKNALANAYFLQAGRRLELADIDGAQKALAKAILLDKGFAMAYWASAELSARQGRSPEAKVLYDRARAIDRDHPRVPLSTTATERPLYWVTAALRGKNWIQLRDGLSYLEVGVPGLTLNLRLWSVDPRKLRIRVVEQGSPFGISVRELLHDERNLVAIQGGFFEMDEGKRLSPAGALVIDGVVRNGVFNRQSGALVYIGGRYDIVWAKEITALGNQSLVLQSGPILVEAPGQNGIKSNDFDRLNRSAVCLSKGAVILVSLYGEKGKGLSLYEFASFLTTGEKDGGVGCEKALNLDGGPSVQAAFKRDGGVQFIPGLWNVQNALVVSTK